MQYTPENREQWRLWLEQNHARETEVWLVFIKKHTRKPNLSYNDAVEEALCFGWIDGIKRSIDEDHYTHRFSPRKPNSKWSDLNRERVRRLLKTGQMAPAGKQAVELAKKNGQWAQPARARTEFPMPSALEIQLRDNPKAADFFASLTRSYQQQYMAWIATAKRPETRQRRVLEAISLLEKGRKLGMR
jgi:uncharacterized protein YdeI (YjbR/CyaY-like superfamily)